MNKSAATKVQQSRTALCDSLAELMQTTPYEKISVSDLCAAAGVSRQTFYNVFDSKEDILRFYLWQAYEEEFQALAGQEGLAAGDAVDAFVRVVAGTREVLDAMIKNRLTGILYEEVLACTMLFTGRFVADDCKDELFPYSEALLAGALSQALVFWLQQDDPVDVAQLKSLLSSFLSGTLYKFADR